MSLRDLADRVGVSYSYMSMVARGHSNMGVKVQARMESALEAPAKVAPAQPACIDREAVWDRMNAHGFSQNEVARRAGISSSNLSQIMNGRNNLSPDVLKRLHGVLFQPTKAERVMPAEVKVLGWRKGERSGMVVRGAGGPGRGAKVRRRHRQGRRPGALGREGGVRLPRGYDGMGRVSVTHVVERGYSAMLKQPETGSCVGLHDVPHDGRLPRSSLGRPAPGRIRESRHRRAFARSSIRLGALPEPDRPRWGGAVRLPSLSALRRRLMETCVRVPASSSNYHEKEDDSNEPRRFHRHVQGRHSQEGGGVLPAPLPALGERPRSPACSASPWGRRPTPSGARPSPSKAHRGTTVVGEMGTGKTFIGAAAAHMAGFERILVLCPPHLVPKWKREVEMTVPGVRAAIVESITDLERLRLSVGSGPLFAVMSREKAKLSYRWMPAVIQRWAVSRGRLLRDEETGEPFRVPCCPDCTAQIVDKDGVPLTDADLNRRKHTCAGCGSPLWQADKSGPARYPLADYVKHRMKGFFDLLVGDEVHEYKGRGSAQGIAAGVLADVCGKSLSLSPGL